MARYIIVVKLCLSFHTCLRLKRYFLNYSHISMNCRAFEPASENICMLLIEKGEQDAKAWIKEMGLEDSQQDIILKTSEDGVILRK